MKFYSNIMYRVVGLPLVMIATFMLELVMEDSIKLIISITLITTHLTMHK